MKVEHRVVAQAAAKAIFSIYKDVENWHTWDPDTKQATLGGQFTVGARGRLVPTKGNAVPMVLTRVEQDRCFTVECKIPLFRLVLEHELSPSGSGTEIVHRVTFSGALAFLIGSMLRKQLNSGLPVTLSRLKAHAEARGVAYGSYKYTYATGRTGTSCLAGFAIRGRETVIYLAPGWEGANELLAQLGKHKMGKGCLYFKRLADLDKSTLEAILAGSVAELKRRYPSAGDA